MTTPELPDPLLQRSQEAQVLTDEANARKATTDADMSALSLAQAKYTSLAPDLKGVSGGSLDDKSKGVAFSGLVIYSALNLAAGKLAKQISGRLTGAGGDRRKTILVTSQSDLLTSDLLRVAIESDLRELKRYSAKVLEVATPQATAGHRTRRFTDVSPVPADAALTRGGAGIAALSATLATGAVATTAWPVALAGAAASAIPSVLSLFSSTTSVKDQTENITELAATTSVVSEVSEQCASYTVLHENFRFAPSPDAPFFRQYNELMDQRTELALRHDDVQAEKNLADSRLAQAQAQLAAAKKAQPDQVPDPSLDDAIEDSAKDSADAAARLSAMTAAITSIDAFATAVNTTSATTRSPLAIASLSQLFHRDGDHPADIGYVLAVKGLGGQAEQYTKHRSFGADTFTSIADASISFLLFDTAEQKIISSGVTNGVSAVHGKLGQAPKIVHWRDLG